MATTFNDIAGTEYILLTTFTKDGRPKPTTVWAAPDGDRLLVITQEKSWKVKRLRNTQRVTIAACDSRGKNVGESVEAVATVLDKTANPATYDALDRRYGIKAKVFSFFSKLRGGMKNNVTIEITAGS